MGISLVSAFGHRVKYWTNWSFDEMMMLDERSGGEHCYYNISSGDHEYLYQISPQSINNC